MNLLDLLIIMVLTYFVYRGAQKGFISELLGLTGWLIAAILALKFGAKVGAMVAARLPQVGGLVGSFGGFILTLLLVHIAFRIMGMVFKKMLGGETQAMVDRFFGALIGFIKGAFIVSVVVLALNSLSTGEKVAAYQERSMLAPHMTKFAQIVIDAIVHFIPEDVTTDTPAQVKEPPSS